MPDVGARALRSTSTQDVSVLRQATEYCEIILFAQRALSCECHLCDGIPKSHTVTGESSYSTVNVDDSEDCTDRLSAANIQHHYAEKGCIDHEIEERAQLLPVHNIVKVQ
jgi:hypothetical protein